MTREINVMIYLDLYNDKTKLPNSAAQLEHWQIHGD